MKKTLFVVWFTNGMQNDIYAFVPGEAVILAQAKAIWDGLDYEVASVQDQETGVVFTVKPMAIERERIH